MDNGLWIGWLAYERYAHREVICYLLELTSPGKDILSRISKEEVVEHQEYRKENS